MQKALKRADKDNYKFSIYTTDIVNNFIFFFLAHIILFQKYIFKYFFAEKPVMNYFKNRSMFTLPEGNFLIPQILVELK